MPLRKSTLDRFHPWRRARVRRECHANSLVDVHANWRVAHEANTDAECEATPAALEGLRGYGREVVDRPRGERRDSDACLESARLVPRRADIERLSGISDGCPEAGIPALRRLAGDGAVVVLAQREALSIPSPISIQRCPVRRTLLGGWCDAVQWDRCRLAVEQLVSVRDGDRLRASLNAELHVNVLHVSAHGLWAEDHQARDVIRSESVAEQSQDLELASRQSGRDRASSHVVAPAEEALNARE